MKLFERYKIEQVLVIGLIVIWTIVILGFAIYKNTYSKVNEVQLIQEDRFVKDVTWIDGGSFYSIEGWGVLSGEEISTFEIYIILWNEEKKEGIVLPTQYKERPDVTAFMNDGVNYDKSGFKAVISKKKLDDAKYNIYIKYQNNGHDICLDTGLELE